MSGPSLVFKHLFLVGFLLMGSGCAKIYHVADEGISSYRIDQKTSAAGETAIEELVAPYRAELLDEMGQVISLVSSPLERGDRNAPESTLGNWVADAILAEAKLITRKSLDFGICNSGGLRIASLPAGPITRGHMYELMPFDNYLVTMRLPGSVVKQLFDQMAASGGWPISAGVSYKIKNERAEAVIIHGKPLDTAKTYEIALSDYLAEGGGGLDFLKDHHYENLGMYYRDALIEYALLQQGISKSLDARVEGRVVNLDQ